MCGRDFSARAMTLGSRTRFTRHVHGGVLLTLVYEGQWIDQTKATGRKLTYGDVLYHPPETVHETASAGGASVITIEVATVTVADFCSLYGRRTEPILLSFDDVDGVAERLYAEMYRGDAAAPFVVHSLILQLLAIASRASVASRGVPAWMSRLIAYIHEHLGERLTAPGLAAIAAVSESHLSHSFPKHLGLTLSDYVRNCRLRAAARALRKTSDPIQQIAWEMGFSDQAHFCRAFKAARGLTPSEYRAARTVATQASVHN